MQGQAKFPEVMKLRGPEGVSAALARAASREHTTVSEYVRRAVISQLKDDGIELSRGAI